MMGELVDRFRQHQAAALAYLDVVRDQNLLAVNRNNEYVLGQEFESTRIRSDTGSASM
jgi:hypothetical protein